jgi:5'-nucleotidase
MHARHFAAAAALALCACAPLPRAPSVDVRLLAFNDFHGNLETLPQGWSAPDPGDGKRRPVAAGGAATLGAAIVELARDRPHVIVVGAGDMIGASPLASSLLRDEPTVRALEALGLELTSVGNHEFDRGRDELLRLQNGGCHPEGCADGEYRGAQFQWLAANVFDSASGRTLLPAYSIAEFDGIRVAFVGAVLRGTPMIVDRAGIAGLEFRDEAASVNALVPGLKRQGIEAIVLLIHEGGRPQGASDPDGCPGFGGAIVDIVRRLDPAVDVVVSGHTHQAYVCRIGGRLVTSAHSYGRMLTAIDLKLDRASGDVRAAAAKNHVVLPDRFGSNPAMEAMVARYAALAAERSGRIAGRVHGEFTPVANRAGESNLGDLVADAHLAAGRRDGAQFAITNPGGLRAPLFSRNAQGSVTFGDLFQVQPFRNILVTMTLTGAQVLQLLENQWRSEMGDRVRMLQVSEGFEYAWDGSRPRGGRVVPDSVRIEGKPLDPNADYRVTVNSFLANGGDGFAVFTEGRDRVVGMGDVEALEAHVRAVSPRAGPPAGRITRRR